jgi:hypothetical protein
MTASFGSRTAPDAAPDARRGGSRRHALAARVALAAAFVMLLFGAVYASAHWAHLVASLAGFATAITLIAVAVINWESLVATARSAGLVEPSH